tara:strand:- start:332 stop:553 length:222 start_codon:yes stop_codon:yes gene_type:complete
MFKKGDPISFYSMEVGTVNGHYEGPFVGDLHKFTALSGEKCAGKLALGGSIFGIKEGHDTNGKRYWNPDFKDA